MLKLGLGFRVRVDDHVRELQSFPISFVKQISKISLWKPVCRRFDTIPACDRRTYGHTHIQTDRHRPIANTRTSIESRG